MIFKPGSIDWLIETPAGKAGVSVRDGQAFLHYTANPHDYRAGMEVKRHAKYFFDMVKARGFDIAYSAVPASDKKLHKFQTMAGMDFLKTVLDHNIYQKVL